MFHSHNAVWIAPLVFLVYLGVSISYSMLREQRISRLAAETSPRVFEYQTQIGPYLVLFAGLYPSGFCLWLLSRMGKSFSEVGWLMSLVMILFVLFLAGVLSLERVRHFAVVWRL